MILSVAGSSTTLGDDTAVDISLESVVRSRLRKLSSTARALLELVSLASRPLRMELISRATGGHQEASIAMTQLRALHMIRARGLDENATVECYHDRIRETVSAAVPAARQHDPARHPVQPEDNGPHYAATRKAGGERGEARLGEVYAQGYDERFVRMWRYYLAYCEGGFRERTIGTCQLLLGGPGARPVQAGLQDWDA